MYKLPVVRSEHIRTKEELVIPDAPAGALSLKCNCDVQPISISIPCSATFCGTLGLTRRESSGQVKSEDNSRRAISVLYCEQG